MDERPTKEPVMTPGLEAILDYQMTPQEARAWKVCCLWCTLSYEIFPDHPHVSVPKKGDPRKGHLFRYAWKMLRETASYGLADQDVALYVRAQFEMIRGIRFSNGTHARLDPNILTGEKAWVRWKMYKRGRDRVNEEHRHHAPETTTPIHRIATELETTRRSLLAEFGVLPTAEQLLAACQDGRLRTWVIQRRVSPYYCLISPLVRQALAGQKMQGYLVGIDLDVYKKDIDREAVKELIRWFPEEFNPA